MPGCYTGIKRLARLADTIRSVYGSPQPPKAQAIVQGPRCRKARVAAARAYTGGVLSEQEQEAAHCIFEAHGYAQPLRIAPIRSEDERVFLLSSTALASLPEGALVAELQAALGRKVALAVDDSISGEPEPLR